MPNGAASEDAGSSNLTVPLTVTDRLFTGQRFDATFGLYDYNARFYDPITGGFTQMDGLVADPLNPRAWNRSSYVYGNPVNYTDPSGQIVESAFDLIDLGLDAGFCLAGDTGSCGWLGYDVLALAAPGLPGSYGSQFYDDAFDLARGVDDCPFNSFSAGTLVHTEAGLVPIETIQAGDKVFAQDPDTGESGYFAGVSLP